VLHKFICLFYFIPFTMLYVRVLCCNNRYSLLEAMAK